MSTLQQLSWQRISCHLCSTHCVDHVLSTLFVLKDWKARGIAQLLLTWYGEVRRGRYGKAHLVWRGSPGMKRYGEV